MSLSFGNAKKFGLSADSLCIIGSRVLFFFFPILSIFLSFFLFLPFFSIIDVVSGSMVVRISSIRLLLLNATRTNDTRKRAQQRVRSFVIKFNKRYFTFVGRLSAMIIIIISVDQRQCESIFVFFFFLFYYYFFL